MLRGRIVSGDIRWFRSFLCWLPACCFTTHLPITSAILLWAAWQSWREYQFSTLLPGAAPSDVSEAPSIRSHLGHYRFSYSSVTKVHERQTHLPPAISPVT